MHILGLSEAVGVFWSHFLKFKEEGITNIRDWLFVFNVGFLPLSQSAARVDSKPSSKTISITPNPADDIIRVLSENSFNSYCITDIAGELIEMNNLGLQQNATIEVSNLKSGFYFLTIEFSDKTLHVQKIVVL